MSWEPTRDLVGYGANPPDPKWPGGARIAINFVVNYEEGSEPSVQDGEGYTETGLTESSTSSQGLKGRDLAGEGMFEYGSRVGFWRIHRAFQERGLPLTLMAAYCAERSARFHGLWPRKGAIRPGSDADLVVLEPGTFAFDEAAIQDRPELRWSPYHGRAMRARVAATLLRGRLVWDGAEVLARPGDGRFLRRGA